MGKSRHTKWYDKSNDDDVYDARHKVDDFKNRRAKRLRTITNKHEELDESDVDNDNVSLYNKE